MKRRRPKLQYKRVEILTVADLVYVERLVARGWRIIRSTLFGVLLEKKS